MNCFLQVINGLLFQITSDISILIYCRAFGDYDLYSLDRGTNYNYINLQLHSSKMKKIVHVIPSISVIFFSFLLLNLFGFSPYKFTPKKKKKKSRLHSSYTNCCALKRNGKKKDWMLLCNEVPVVPLNIPRYAEWCKNKLILIMKNICIFKKNLFEMPFDFIFLW